jgi:hypothetical protein
MAPIVAPAAHQRVIRVQQRVCRGPVSLTGPFTLAVAEANINRSVSTQAGMLINKFKLNGPYGVTRRNLDTVD